MVNFNERENIKQLINALFISIDNKKWKEAIECFTEVVELDLSGLGVGKSGNVKCDDIKALFEKHFSPFDKMHHQTADFRIDAGKDSSNVFCYVVIYCYKEDASKNNKVKRFVGSFDFKVSKKASIDKISAMTYNHKFIDGNEDL